MENTGFKREYNYQDIYLLPKKTIVNSRKECDTSVTFGNRKFDLPIFPSHMKSVIDENTCKFLTDNNIFYTMHRFGISIKEFFIFAQENNIPYTSISVGINKESYDQLNEVKKENIEYITIDVANAWSEKTHEMIKFIKKNFPKSFLVVGNVATGDAALELQKWGADSVKIGIAGGSPCITKNKTGFHRPMVTTIDDCFNKTSVPLIADGGITENGDIAKAIACGATLVMAGSLFAGYDESAGKIVEIENKRYKEYFGNASEFNKKELKNIEGKKILMPYKGAMNKLLKEIKEDLQSSISYSGGKTLQDLINTDKIAIN